MMHLSCNAVECRSVRLQVDIENLACASHLGLRGRIIVGFLFEH